MDSREPQSPPPPPQQQQSPPRSQPLHLQPAVVLFGANPFVNNMNTTNPSPHSESFNNNAIVTAPSITVQPCMKTVVEGSSSAFISASGANKRKSHRQRKSSRPRKFVLPKANDGHLNSGSGKAHSESFNNNAIVTAPSTTVQPCMKTVVEGSSSAFISASGANKRKSHRQRKSSRPRKFVLPKANDGHLNSGSGEAQADPAPAPIAPAPADLNSGSGEAQADPAPAPIAPAPAVVTSANSSTAMNTRGIGRPHESSRKKDVKVHGHAGSCFFPHLIDVNPGEDIIAKLTSAFRGGHESDEFCVLNVNGLVSTTVALLQSGTIVIYEGPFQIVSMSGSFKRVTDWRVELVLDSQVIGGPVTDKLIAVSSVKVIVGSFTLLEHIKASLNDWLKFEPSAPSSQFAAFEIPANAIVQEPASDQSSDEFNENIPLIAAQGPFYNDD